MHLFFLTNAKSAHVKLQLPSGATVSATTDAQGYVNTEVPGLTHMPPSFVIPAGAFQYRTDSFMVNSLFGYLVSVIGTGKLSQAKRDMQMDRLLELFGTEMLENQMPLWKDFIDDISGKEVFRELQTKIARTGSQGTLHVVKGISSPAKPTTIFMNFINHEIESDIVPALYKHCAVNGGTAILRFSSFASGPFCQVIFTPQSLTTLIGEEDGTNIKIHAAHQYARETINHKIQLSDMGFLQHIATTWMDAIAEGQEQPHQNIEVILFDAKNGEDKDLDTRQRYVLVKLRTLFDEMEPADTDRLWVGMMRDVFMNMGMSDSRSHIVSGRIVRGQAQGKSKI